MGKADRRPRLRRTLASSKELQVILRPLCIPSPIMHILLHLETCLDTGLFDTSMF